MCCSYVDILTLQLYDPLIKDMRARSIFVLRRPYLTPNTKDAQIDEEEEAKARMYALKAFLLYPGDFVI
jgi:hypothetical protein